MYCELMSPAISYSPAAQLAAETDRQPVAICADAVRVERLGERRVRPLRQPPRAGKRAGDAERRRPRATETAASSRSPPQNSSGIGRMPLWAGKSGKTALSEAPPALKFAARRSAESPQFGTAPCRESSPLSAGVPAPSPDSAAAQTGFTVPGAWWPDGVDPRGIGRTRSPPSASPICAPSARRQLTVASMSAFRALSRTSTGASASAAAISSRCA